MRAVRKQEPSPTPFARESLPAPAFYLFQIAKERIGDNLGLCAYAHIFQRQQLLPQESTVAASNCAAIGYTHIDGLELNGMNFYAHN
jgi:hypothetical protein